MPFTSHSLALLPLVLLAVLTVSGPGAVAGEENAADYDLSVTFAPEGHSLRGTARIILPAGAGIDLDLHGLTVDGSAAPAGKWQGDVSAAAAAGDAPSGRGGDPARTIYLLCESGADSPDKLIDPAGIVLTGLWHPVPQRQMRFRLSAGLPPGLSAVVESDRFPLAKDGDRLVAAFSRPLQNLHFVAGPYVEDSLEVRPGLRVYSLFFAEDRQLAPGYLEAAAATCGATNGRSAPTPTPIMSSSPTACPPDSACRPSPCSASRSCACPSSKRPRSAMKSSTPGSATASRSITPGATGAKA